MNLKKTNDKAKKQKNCRMIFYSIKISKNIIPSTFNE